MPEYPDPMRPTRDDVSRTESIPRSTNRDSSLPPFFSLIFSTRAMSYALSVILVAQLTFYATDAVGLPAGIIGGLFLAARVFDAVTDLIVNYVIDKTRTRWGKARPYELFIVPLWIFIVAVFSTPDMSQTWQLVYIFVMFWLITAVCQTALAACEAVYLKRAVDGEERYAKVLSRQALFVMVLPAVGGVTLPQLISAWGDEPGGWTRIALVYGVPAIVLGLIRFIFIKERPFSDEEEVGARPSLKEVVMAVLRNKYAFYLGALILLSTTVVQIGQTIGLYYFKYVLGNVGLQSLVSIGILILPFAFLLFPLAVRKVGGMNFVRIGLVIAIIGFMAVFVAPGNLPVVIAGTILGGFSATITMLIGFFSIQVMTYGQWKTGTTIEAAPQMVTGIASKLGQGIAPAAVGVLLAVVGYDGALESQAAEVDTMIIAVYALIPALLCAVMFVVSFAWRLDNRLDAIRGDLENGVDASTSSVRI